jgi:cation diffusion facilitator CzcD-associated flavoprotein CzcO
MSDRKFNVVVVGAGIAGLFIAEKLKRAGITFSVFEKANEVGGTWRDNTYPGLYVDVLSRQYEFPFRPNYDWSRKYAPASEIQAYIKRVADECGLRKFIRFNEEIVSAQFSDGRWHLVTKKGEKVIANVFVAATGFLRQPLLPDIAGRETFAGRSFHSARWDHSIPYKGNRWGVIGGGASGIQITEALAWENCDVVQFIRRPQWVHIRENPRTTIWERLMLRLPFMYRRRQQQLWRMINAGDQWRLKPGPARVAMEREYRGYLDMIGDPDLRRKLTPDYHLGCTRIPKSDRNYYEAVQKPNVTLEFGRISRIVPEGIEMADGTVHRLDVLVYATGYDPHAYMRPMQVTGIDGVDLDTLWKDRIYSYGGIALPGFPNLFMLYGPFSPVNNVPVPIGLDHEISYIMRLIDRARRELVTITPTAAAARGFVARLDAAFPDTVFVGCRNWYSDATGTPVLWPLSQDAHQEFFRKIDWDDFEIGAGS